MKLNESRDARLLFYFIILRFRRHVRTFTLGLSRIYAIGAHRLTRAH